MSYLALGGHSPIPSKIAYCSSRESRWQTSRVSIEITLELIVCVFECATRHMKCPTSGRQIRGLRAPEHRTLRGARQLADVTASRFIPSYRCVVQLPKLTMLQPATLRPCSIPRDERGSMLQTSSTHSLNIFERTSQRVVAPFNTPTVRVDPWRSS